MSIDYAKEPFKVVRRWGRKVTDEQVTRHRFGNRRLSFGWVRQTYDQLNSLTFI